MQPSCANYLSCARYGPLGVLALLLLSLFSVHPVAAQSASDGVVARIQIEREGDRLQATGLCENHTGKKQALRYELTFSREDANGNRNNTNQMGEFIVKAGEAHTLSSSATNLGPDAQLEILLEIFDGRKRIARDRYQIPDH